MKKSFFVIMAAFTLFSCGEKAYVSDLRTPSIDEFDYKVEEFADMGILRYRAFHADSRVRTAVVPTAITGLPSFFAELTASAVCSGTV